MTEKHTIDWAEMVGEVWESESKGGAIEKSDREKDRKAELTDR